jgi:hypothetical protein
MSYPSRHAPVRELFQIDGNAGLGLRRRGVVAANSSPAGDAWT